MLKDILRKNDDSFILINGVTFERAKVLKVFFEVVGERNIGVDKTIRSNPAAGN